MDFDEDAAMALKADGNQDGDSGSAYESHSDREHSSSHDERVKSARSSRASSERARGRSKKPAKKGTGEQVSSPDDDEGANDGTVSQSPGKKEQIREEAQQWAATFEPPQSVDKIPAPKRPPAGNRSKKKPQLPPTEAKVKRLRSFYNTEYRDLLNRDINDASSRAIREEYEPLQGGQIGSSIWTSAEKDLFFSSLSRLGRDDIRGISNRIGTKSELELREYIQLLQHGLESKENHSKLLILTDFPAAHQISEECSTLLERAADALSSRQELYEEGVERKKWGDSWLLTTDVNQSLERKRSTPEGVKALNEILPAANLFNLKNWLELSENIFMNSSALHEEDNWNSIAEEGETPAIRATAFEDFHSLVVNITKKLVSTTMFVTMSRERATGTRKMKHAEINAGDVEAAVQILKMKPNSQDFWMKCARRNNIQIIDDESASRASEDTPMSYNEVEAALGSRIQPRSESTSRAPSPEPANPQESSDEFQSADESLADYESEGPSLSDSDFLRTSRPGTPSKRALDQKAQERAQQRHVEAFDMDVSYAEELRLWELLKQKPPPDIKREPLEEMDRSKMGKREVERDGNWRDRMEFWSQWETVDGVVPEEEFEKNRKRKRRRIARTGREAGLLLSLEFVDEEDLTSVDGSEDEENETEIIVSSEDQEGGEDQDHDAEINRKLETAQRAPIPRESWISDDDGNDNLAALIDTLAAEYQADHDEMSFIKTE